MDLLTPLLAESAPGRTELLALCILPTAIGLGVYIALSRRDPAEMIYKLRFAGLIPLVIGLVMGGPLAMRMANDYVYQQVNLIGRNMQVLHYAAVVIPILGIAAVLVLEVLGRRKPRYEF